MNTERSGVANEASAGDSGRYGQASIFPLSLVTQGSFKRQIILTFVLGFFLMTAAFTVYLVHAERTYLYRESAEDAASLPEALATSALPRLLSGDISGLQEVVRALQGHPELRYAMVISPAGEVLAHSDAAQVGQFISGEPGLALNQSPPRRQVLMDDEHLIDIAAPIMSGNRLAGWARAAHGRESVAGNLRNLMLAGALFVLMAVVLSLLAALFIANRLGYRIGKLMRVAEAVQAGNYATRAGISGADEIAWLADSLNHMLDKLARDEEQLRASSLYTRSLIEASLDPLVTISPAGKITDVNKASEQATGRSRAELIGMDFSDYFTEPDKAREGYRQVFQQGSVTDYPLAIRHKDGHVTDVLYNASVYRDEAGNVLGVFAAARDVTARKRAEAVLRESEEALKEAQRIARLGSWHMDLATNRVVWSEVLYEMYGFDPALPPPLYTESMKLFTPESWERLSASIARTTETGIPYEIELETVNKEGGRGWMWARGELVRDAGGAPVRIRGVVMDITARKQAEEKIRESEKKFKAMTDTSPLAIYMSSGIEQKAEYINPRFTQLFGYTLEEVPTVEQWWPRAYPDAQYRKQVAEEWQHKVEHAIQTNSEIEPMEVVVTCKDGSKKNILWGYISTGIQNWAFGLDLTERKRAEEGLRRSEKGLAEAQRMAHLGNWSLDLANNVLTWSDEIYRIFEIDPERFGASYEAFLDAIHPEDRDKVNNAYTESLRNKQPYDIVHRLLMKDGRVKYVNERCETHYGEDGRPLRSIGTVHDITEQKVAEIALTALKDDLENRVKVRTSELETANKELEAFSYSVSHDLRTPLRAIDGFSHILLEEYAGKLDDEGKRLLRVVRDNTGKMQRLIDDILKFSRAGRLEINFSGIDMESLVREVYEELRPAAGPGLQVEIGHLPPAMGDRAMMRQVFVNLLSNAIKFTRNKEGARIEAGSFAGENETVYFVKDNGAGFNMQYVDRLFGVFQRLHSESEFEGTGIGLAIVKRIVTRHGGRVWAEGKLGEGAAFYFALPAKAV